MGPGTEDILDAQDDFRALFESAPDLMYTHDLAGILTRVNRAFERVTGYTREEALGWNFFDLVADNDRHESRQRVFAQLGGEIAIPFAMTLLNKQGEPIQLEVSTELTFRDGRPAGVQGFARDVSQIATFTRYLKLLHRLSTTNYRQIDTLLGDYLATGCEIFGVERGAITSKTEGTLKVFGDTGQDLYASDVARARTTIARENPFYLGTPIIIADSVYGVIGFWTAIRQRPGGPILRLVRS